MKRCKQFIPWGGATVFLAILFIATAAPAQPVTVFNEDFEDGLGEDLFTITSGETFTPTGNEWLPTFDITGGGFCINDYTQAYGLTRMFRHNIKGTACPDALFRAMLPNPLSVDDWSSFTISGLVEFTDGTSAVNNRVYFYLASDGGETAIPTNGYAFFHSYSSSGSDRGGFLVTDSGGPVTQIIGSGTPSKNAEYEIIATFIEEGANTRVKYTYVDTGTPDAALSGETTIANTVAAGTVFDRVVIRLQDYYNQRPNMDNVLVTAVAKGAVQAWSFGANSYDFGPVDTANGQVGTVDVEVWGSGTIASVTFSGSSASEMSLVAPSLPQALSGGLTTFGLQWAPTLNTGASLTSECAIFEDTEGTTKSVQLLGFTRRYTDIKPYVPDAYTDYRQDSPAGAIVAHVAMFLPAVLACNQTTTFWAENRNSIAGVYQGGVLAENAVFSYGVNDFYGTDAATKLFVGSTGSTNDEVARGDVRLAIEQTVFAGAVASDTAYAFRPAGVLDTDGTLYLAMAGVGQLMTSNQVYRSTIIADGSGIATQGGDAIVKAVPDHPTNPTMWTFTVLAYEDGICYPAKIGTDLYVVKSAHQADPSAGGGEITKIDLTAPPVHNPGNPGIDLTVPVFGLGKADFAAALGLSGDAVSSFALVSTATDGTNLYVGVNNVGYDPGSPTTSTTGDVARADDRILKISGLPGSPVISTFLDASALDSWMKLDEGAFGDLEPDAIEISPSGDYLVVVSQNNTKSSSAFLNNGDGSENAREGVMIFDISGATPVLWEAVRESVVVAGFDAGFTDNLDEDDDSLAVTEIGDDLVCFLGTQNTPRSIIKMRFDSDDRAHVLSIEHDGPLRTSATLLNFIVTFDKPIDAALALRSQFEAVVLPGGDLTPTIAQVSPSTGMVSSVTVTVVLPGLQFGHLQLQIPEMAQILPILWKDKPYTEGDIVQVYSPVALAKEWRLY